MRNVRLENAMALSHVSVEAIAKETNVDPRTVKRWIKGRAPHPCHRWTVAELLHVPEDVLWPADMSEVEKTPGQSEEIISAYAHRTDVPPSAWWHLFSKAQQHIDLLGYAMLFLPEQHSGLTSLLKEKGSVSCKIRIALADPNDQHVQERDREERLGGTLPARIQTTLYHFRDILNSPGIEIRFHRTPLYNSVFRFDNEMFVTPHLYGLHGSRAPLLHLCGLEANGIFASFAAHFEAVWATGTPVVQPVPPVE